MTKPVPVAVIDAVKVKQKKPVSPKNMEFTGFFTALEWARTINLRFRSSKVLDEKYWIRRKHQTSLVPIVPDCIRFSRSIAVTVAVKCCQDEVNS